MVKCFASHLHENIMLFLEFAFVASESLSSGVKAYESIVKGKKIN